LKQRFIELIPVSQRSGMRTAVHELHNITDGMSRADMCTTRIQLEALPPSVKMLNLMLYMKK